MKRILALPALVAVGVILAVGHSSAWTYQLTGQGLCQPDGTFKINWTIDNTTENEAFKVTASTRAVVPVGTHVPKHQTETFTESVPGKAGDTTLQVTGHWNGDKTDHVQKATVSLAQDCTQPVTPTTPTTTPPVTAPAPTVNETAPVTPVVSNGQVFTGK